TTPAWPSASSFHSAGAEGKQRRRRVLQPRSNCAHRLRRMLTTLQPKPLFRVGRRAAGTPLAPLYAIGIAAAIRGREAGMATAKGKDRNKASRMRRWIFRIWRQGSEGLERQSNVSYLATLPNNSKKSSAWKRRAPQHAGLFFSFLFPGSTLILKPPA